MFTTRKLIAGAVSGALCLSMLAAGVAALEVPAPKKGSDINVDGILDEAHWGAATWTPIAVAKSGDPDNTGEIAVTWDDKCLYFAVKVVEDNIVTDVNGLDAGLYTHDGVEIFFERNDDPASATGIDSVNGDTVHITYSHSTGDVQITAMSHPAWEETDELESIVIKSVNTDDGYTVECSVELEDAYVTDAAVGALFAFGASVNDDDDPASWAAADRKELDLTETHAYNNPSTWATFTLGEALEIKAEDTGSTDAGNTDAGNTDAGNTDTGSTTEPGASADTFDLTGIALAASALSAAAFAISKKRR